MTHAIHVIGMYAVLHPERRANNKGFSPTGVFGATITEANQRVYVLNLKGWKLNTGYFVVGKHSCHVSC